MKIRYPNFWVIAGTILLGLLLTRGCKAADGFYRSDGFVNHGSDGIDYFHGSDGENGWQSTTNGVTYFHSNGRNCVTNGNSGNSWTSCREY